MNIATAIIVLVFFLAFLLGIRVTLKHLRGEGGGCCGSATPPPPAQKTPAGHIIARKRLKINGMHCMHCVQSVTRALNALDGVSADVHLDQQLALVSLEREVSDETLRKAVADTGFEVTEVTNSPL